MENLVIIGGEAHAVFADCLRDASVDEIFVNYPDPPVWNGSTQTLGVFFTGHGEGERPTHRHTDTQTQKH